MKLSESAVPTEKNYKASLKVVLGRLLCFPFGMISFQEPCQFGVGKISFDFSISSHLKAVVQRALNPGEIVH